MTKKKSAVDGKCLKCGSTSHTAHPTCVERDQYGRRSCRLPAWGESRFCIDHDNAATPNSLANQLEKAHTEIADLEAKVMATESEAKALRVMIAGADLSNVEWDLLTRIAHNVLTRRVSESALQAARHDPNTRPGPKKKNEQPTPGGVTSAARRHGNNLITNLTRACQTYETARTHMWHPPKPDDDRPRCWRRDCKQGYSKPQTRGTIVCGWCARPFTRREEDED